MSARARPPVLPPPPSPQLPPVHRHRLANGLDVHLVERRELPVIDARLVIRGGAYGDVPERAGRAYMVGDLLDQGTTTRSALDIAHQAELLGASLETRASWDAFAAALHVLTPRIEPALELLADVVLRADFPPPEIERRTCERLAAILQERDEARTVATQAFSRHAYGAAHPFAAPLGGTRESIEVLQRADLTGLYKARFSPVNAFLVLVGDITARAALPMLDRLFAAWSAPAVEPAPAFEVLPQTTTAVHIVDRPAAPQSELRIGLPGPRRDTEDYFALLVANTILGGAFTSRLNMRLREEKGYTYGAGSSFALRAGGGPFMASTAVATAATADAVDVIVTEIARMADEAVPVAELERAKSYIVLGLPRTFETTGDIAEHVSEVALFGLAADYYDTYAAHVRAVSASDVRAASARWLKRDRLTIAIAGDGSSVMGDMDSLKIGAVHVDENG
ncbi:MAG: M16 family metallopeptidase [Longimicrobiales bacterium]